MPREHRFSRLADKLGCLGYYGLGTGWAIAKGRKAPYGYCHTCSKELECRKATLPRIRTAMPEACTFYDYVVAGVGVKHAAAVFEQLTSKTDPYTLAAAVFACQGSTMALGQRQHDHGPLTIPSWPLPGAENGSEKV